MMFSKNLCSVVCLLISTAQLSTADLGDIQSPVDFSLANIVESDVSFYVYQSSSPQEFEKISVGGHANFGVNTRFIIHGYGESSATDWVHQIRDAFLTKDLYTVIVVDWSSAAANYELGASNVKKLGEFVGQFIFDNIVQNSEVEIIGSCLGAHAAGHVGKYLQRGGFSVAKIFGLDAAAKKFEDPAVPEENRIARSDSALVVLIHTNARQWGFKQPIGSIDFYPNEGNVQPGCDNGDLDADVCSHLRANYYFAESINTLSFGNEVLISIENGLVVTTPLDSSRISHFGDQVQYDDQPGTFIITTQSSAPYLITSA